MKDFSDVSILHEAYDSINSQVSLSSSLQALHLGLSQRQLVILYQHRLLQIVKALLLQKRVIVFGSPAEKVSNIVLSIVGLFPLSLEAICDSDIKPDKHGLPLEVFDTGLSLQPYVCLQQMESLSHISDSSPLLIGAVNPLFEKQQRRLCDVFIDVEGGLVTSQDPETRSLLHLTSADLRFCDLLTQSIQEHSGLEEPMTFSRSSEWIRTQFKFYLLSLLATSENGDTVSLDEFGRNFTTNWLKSGVLERWKKRERGGIIRVDPSHPCEGEVSLGDVRRRLVARMSDYGLNVPSGETVVQETQRIVSQAAERVSGVWTAASTTVYSWWAGDQTGDR